jgi:TolA-binding protein
MFSRFNSFLFSVIAVLLLLTLTNCSSNKGKEEFEGAVKKETEKKYPEAVKEFQSIIDQYPKSDYAAKSMIELADLYGNHRIEGMNRDEDFHKATEYYVRIIGSFPDLPEVGKASFELGRIYQSLLVPGITKEESLKRSIACYRTVISRYPSTSDAESALFMVGFVQANELKQLDSAKTTYQLFLQKYPASKYANSVNIELNNLGSNPEEILRKNQETAK